MSEFELRRRLQGLAQAREPARDLWPAIAARLAPQAQVRRNPARWPWAAAAVLALAAGAVTYVTRHAAPDAASPVAQARGAGASPRYTVAQAEALAASYDGALEAAAGGARGVAVLRESASPSVRAADAEILAAQRALEQALVQDPQSDYLLDLLRQTHEQRLRLYRTTLVG